jgi:hypothetical protein
MKLSPLEALIVHHLIHTGPMGRRALIRACRWYAPGSVAVVLYRLAGRNLVRAVRRGWWEATV